MKKVISTLFLGLVCTIGVQAQEYNLFQDVDADGWLWFDSQEKIDKYIGLCDEENYKADPDGKPIQLIYADQLDDYPPTIADPIFIGAGKEGIIGGEGFRTGAIIAEPSTGTMTANGGGIVIKMPSCTTFGICLSCENQVRVALKASKDNNADFKDYTVIKTYAFTPLFYSGIHTWSGIENLDNNWDDGRIRKIQSNDPINALVINTSVSRLYIHGIRVTTPTKPSSIKETVSQQKSHIFFEGNRVVLNEPAELKVYSTDGLLVASQYTDRMDLSDMPKGIYIVKAGDATRKLAVQ